VTQQRYNELRERMRRLVQVEVGDRETVSVDWRAEEGRDILTRGIDQLDADIEDLGRMTSLEVRSEAAQRDAGR